MFLQNKKVLVWIIVGIIVVFGGSGLYIKKLINDAYNYKQYTDKGYNHLLRGELVPAIVEFRKAAEIRPGSYDVHFGIGSVYLKQRRFGNAAEELGMAIQINPDAQEAHYSLGVTYHRMKNYDLALQEYKEVLKKNPNSIQVHNNIGGIYLIHGNYDEAIKYFRKSIDINPEYYQAYLNLGKVYETQGKNVEAIAVYEKIVEISSRIPGLEQYAVNAKKRISKLRNVHSSQR